MKTENVFKSVSGIGNWHVWLVLGNRAIDYGRSETGASVTCIATGARDAIEQQQHSTACASTSAQTAPVSIANSIPYTCFYCKVK